MIHYKALIDLVANEERSCSLLASTEPIHITVTKRRTCATKSQPWNVEAPIGQRLRMSLLDFTASTEDDMGGQRKQPCIDYGVIVDKASRRNVSICGGTGHRTMELHVSRGNEIGIIFNDESGEETVGDSKRYLLAVTSEIILIFDSLLFSTKTRAVGKSSLIIIVASLPNKCPPLSLRTKEPVYF